MKREHAVYRDPLWPYAALWVAILIYVSAWIWDAGNQVPSWLAIVVAMISFWVLVARRRRVGVFTTPERSLVIRRPWDWREIPISRIVSVDKPAPPSRLLLKLDDGELVPLRSVPFRGSKRTVTYERLIAIIDGPGSK